LRPGRRKEFLMSRSLTLSGLAALAALTIAAAGCSREDSSMPAQVPKPRVTKVPFDSHA
jgi:hypothetical protein